MISVFLDPPTAPEIDWDELASVIDDAYRLVAPKRLVAKLRSGADGRRWDRA